MRSIICILQFNRLPQSLAARILSFVDTHTRLRASTVSKEWRNLLAQSWVSIQLSSAMTLQHHSLVMWLDRMASDHAEAIREFELDLRGELTSLECIQI